MSDQKMFIVRLYDGMDNCWTDVSEPLAEAEAKQVWLEKTENGTRATKYDDIDYYRIFPADTTMVNSERGNRELGIETIR